MNMLGPSPLEVGVAPARPAVASSACGTPSELRSTSASEKGGVVRIAPADAAEPVAPPSNGEAPPAASAWPVPRRPTARNAVATVLTNLFMRCLSGPAASPLEPQLHFREPHIS